MRTFRTPQEAFKLTERDLYEMGLPDGAGYKNLRPWIYQIIFAGSGSVDELYALKPGSENIKEAMIEQLPSYNEEFRGALEPNGFISVEAIFPGQPTELETKTLISRMAFERNGKIHMAVTSMSLSLYGSWALKAILSIHFLRSLAEANNLEVGSFYHMTYDLYESNKNMESKDIF